MTELHQVLRTVVNTWECDEMGHLNVRFYPARESEAVRVLLGKCGATEAALQARGLRVRFVEKHIRFQREMRPGTAFSAFAGFIDVSEAGLRTYCELRGAKSGQVNATVVGELQLCRAGSSQPVPVDAQLQRAARQYMVALPEHGAPRGITPTPPRAAPTLAEALDLGMQSEYLGLADPEHVDRDGFVEPAGHIARVSDGIQHFFLTFVQEHRREGIGGAVLEFRLVNRHEARVGDAIEIRSGLKAVAPKTRHFCHWIFDAHAGTCLATAEVVAVSFDLTARKAVAFSDEELAAMQGTVLSGISC